MTMVSDLYYMWFHPHANQSFPDKKQQVAITANQKYLLQFTSMEQLWLVRVMKELYNKIWNKTDWIK